MKYAAGIRARAGVAGSRVLGYGTAGPAWARIGERFTTSNVRGYQAGGGAEFRIMMKASGPTPPANAAAPA